VQPIFQANCYRCHGGMNHRGGLNIATRAGMMKGGHNGAVLVPGDPAKSLLVRLIRHEGPQNDPMPMPPKAKLSDADIATVERWVRAGAIMPADAPVQ
jgi:mono/diheme cytochrome c family protein